MSDAPDFEVPEDAGELSRWLEALLFLSPAPLSLTDLCELTTAAPGPVQRAIGELRERFGADHGIEIAEVAGGYSMRTHDELAAVCDRLRERPPDDKLSPAAMETLAVVAYLEPVTRPDIGRLRGVQVDSVVAVLLERGLIEESGRADGGGGVLYRTTRAFQERFDLRGPGDLPPLERFELTGPQADEIRRRLTEAGHLAGASGDHERADDGPEGPERGAPGPTTAANEGPAVPAATEDDDRSDDG